MSITENKIPKFYLITLYILSGVFLFWGLTQLKGLFSHISLILVQLFGFSISIYMVVNYVLEGLIILGLIVLIIKVIQLGNYKPSTDLSEFNLNKSKLIKLGLSVLIITGLNILITYLTQDKFESDIAIYIEKNIDTYNVNMVYMQLAIGLIELFRKVLIFALYFLLIHKLPDKESTNANKPHKA